MRKNRFVGRRGFLRRVTGLSLSFTLLYLPNLTYAASTIPLGLPLEVQYHICTERCVEKIKLGELLFNEKRLSSNNSISCASCHQPEKAFTDGRQTAEGVEQQLGVRNTPSLLNALYFSSQFWDGRRDTLESQALDPLFNPVEHGLAGAQDVLTLIRSEPDYAERFQKAFSVTPDQIEIEHVAKAIAAFERTLLSGNSRFDRFQYAGELDALSAEEQDGLNLFRGRAQCTACHTINNDSALFADNSFHRLGVGFKVIESRLSEIAHRYVSSEDPTADLTPLEISELGRFIVTRKPSDIGKFKTPSLRNVALTAPYMHDGSVETLEEAVDLEIYYRSREAGRPLILSPQEKDNLVAFLKALTSDKYERDR